MYITADVTLTVAIKMDQKIVNNDMHASLAKVELKINAKNGRFLLDRLLNGRAVFLQDLLNQSINENFQIWISELYPVMEEKIIETISVIINKISSSFTKAQLFP